MWQQELRQNDIKNSRPPTCKLIKNLWIYYQMQKEIWMKHVNKKCNPLTVFNPHWTSLKIQQKDQWRQRMNTYTISGLRFFITYLTVKYLLRLIVRIQDFFPQTQTHRVSEINTHLVIGPLLQDALSTNFQCCQLERYGERGTLRRLRKDRRKEWERGRASSPYPFDTLKSAAQLTGLYFIVPSLAFTSVTICFFVATVSHSNCI